MQYNIYLYLFHHPKKIFEKYFILMEIYPINYTNPIYCARMKNEMENYPKVDKLLLSYILFILDTSRILGHISKVFYAEEEQIADL